MYIYRLLDHAEGDPFMNMAIDEAVAMACKKGYVPPTIRFYTWDSPVLSVGRFQKIERDINIKRCNKLGIDIVRRISGGKTVYHKDELTYSVISRRDNNIFPRNRNDCQKIIADGLVSGLKRLGIEANINNENKRYTGDEPYCFLSASRNEIVFKGKKIIGSAQKRWIDIFLQQGSILLDFNSQEAISLFISQSKEVIEKKLREIDERVTSLKKILDIDIQLSEIKEAFMRGFKEVFGIWIEEGTITQYERELSIKLAEEKYSPFQRIVNGSRDILSI